jgi:adenine/guanine phosphoribosyltransferase-like PRPP-binding protein
MRAIEYALQGHEDEFDAVVVTGLSGTIPAAIYCYQHDKQLVVIRKDDDITHGVRTEGKEYFAAGTPYIIIDDFISLGHTMQRIYDKLDEFGHDEPKYVVLYDAHNHASLILLDGTALEGSCLDDRAHLFTVTRTKRVTCASSS